MFYTQSTGTVISRWKKKEGKAGKQKPKQNMKQLPESVAVYPRQGREQGSGREWPAPCPAAAAGGHPLSSVASGTARHSSPLHPQSHVAALTCTSVRPVCRHMNYTNRGRKGLKEWSTLSLPIHVDADKKITKYTLHNCFRKLQHLGKIRKTCIYIYIYTMNPAYLTTYLDVSMYWKLSNWLLQMLLNICHLLKWCKAVVVENKVLKTAHKWPFTHIIICPSQHSESYYGQCFLKNK